MEHYVIGKKNPLRVNIDKNKYLYESATLPKTITITNIAAKLKKNKYEITLEEVNNDNNLNKTEKVKFNDIWTKFSLWGVTFLRNRLNSNQFSISYAGEKLSEVSHYKLYVMGKEYLLYYGEVKLIFMEEEKEILFNVEFDDPIVNVVEYSSMGMKDKYMCIFGTGLIRMDTDELMPSINMNVTNNLSPFYVKITDSEDRIIEVERIMVSFAYN